jgi:two-component system nitrogen regulation response regulator GlnG
MQILLADTDKGFADAIVAGWSLADANLMAVTSRSEIISILQQESFQAVFLSADCLAIDGLATISFVKEHQPTGTEVIVLCDPKQLQVAEDALAAGAGSYLLKPVSVRTLQDAARKSLGRIQNRKNYRLMEDHVLEDLLGTTPQMKKILRTLYKVAPTSSTLLITGESGTGKEFVANIIHRLSKRADEPFVAVNCGAIPENIVESELFGSKKGAFTGAVADKKGLFEEADRGTLFLDEVGELPLSTQVKLLRFLEDREIRRVGATESRKVDVRIIAATNRDLQKDIRASQPRFREDLFYRLNTFQLHLPPLRERMSALPSLVKHFLLKYSQQESKEIQSIEPAALLALSRYDYPGNVRELANIIEHAVVMSEGSTIFREDLPERLLINPSSLALPALTTSTALTTQTGTGTGNFLAGETPWMTGEPGTKTSPVSEVPWGSELRTAEPPTQEVVTPSSATDGFASETHTPMEPAGAAGERPIHSLAQVEKEYIAFALQQLGHNQTEVARKLGISRSTLWRKLQEHKLEPPG